jgi:hypothetical protein
MARTYKKNLKKEKVRSIKVNKEKKTGTKRRAVGNFDSYEDENLNYD